MKNGTCFVYVRDKQKGEEVLEAFKNRRGFKILVVGDEFLNVYYRKMVKRKLAKKQRLEELKTFQPEINPEHVETAMLKYKIFGTFNISDAELEETVIEYFKEKQRKRMNKLNARAAFNQLPPMDE